MVWVKTFSGFFPSLLSYSVVCPNARAGGSASTVASSSQVFCMVVLPDQGVLLISDNVGTILPDRVPNVRLKIEDWPLTPCAAADIGAASATFLRADLTI
jgi:hypothetical protein